MIDSRSFVISAMVALKFCSSVLSSATASVVTGQFSPSLLLVSWLTTTCETALYSSKNDRQLPTEESIFGRLDGHHSVYFLILFKPVSYSVLYCWPVAQLKCFSFYCETPAHARVGSTTHACACATTARIALTIQLWFAAYKLYNCSAYTFIFIIYLFIYQHSYTSITSTREQNCVKIYRSKSII